MINDGTPTLIIGLGGIGGQIVGSIFEKLSEQNRRTVSVIAIDTSVHDLWKLRNKRPIPCIQLCDDLSNHEIIENNPDVMEWFPDEPHLLHHTFNCGTGQIRAIARLEFVNAEKQGRLNVIEKEISRIRSESAKTGHSTCLKVCIVGTITGGTGSGLAVSLPFYLRHLINNSNGFKRYEINGYFIGADPIQRMMPTAECRNRVRANTYACLKELNAFFMRPMMSGNSENNIRLEFYDPSDLSVQNVPYHKIVLLDDYLDDVRLDAFIDDYAQKLFSNMIINSQPASIEIPDHFGVFMRNALSGGMNRYCSAGICQLVYPQKTAQEYVALALVKGLISDEWLLIDNEYNSIVKRALKLMIEDAHIKKPELKNSYVELFREKTLGDHAQLCKLAQQAYIEKDNEYIPKSVGFIANMYSTIDDLLYLDGLRDKEELCIVNMQKMKTFNDAEGHISDVWEGLRRYSQYAKRLIDTKPNQIADDFVPILDECVGVQRRSGLCIYQLISEVHPVTARFLIYDIINRLEENVKLLKEKITDVDLSAYIEEDFDAKTEGVQNPLEYLTSLQDKPHPFLKMLGPIGRALNTDEKSLAKLGDQLSEVSKSHVSTVREYMTNRIKYHVSQICLERLYKFSDIYTLFFSAILEFFDENDINLERLEHLCFPYNQYGIYCSAEAFKKMTSEFSMYQLQDISSESKKAISDQIFTTFFKSYSISNTKETPKERKQRVQKDKDMLISLFKTAVVDEIRKQVLEYGTGIVNLTAREALIKEIELNEQMLPGDDGYYVTVENSVKNTVSFAIKRALPMLRTELLDSKIEQLVLILSPECAEVDAELKPDNAYTARFYLRDFSDTTVIINKEASDTELTLIRICHNYTVEDILNYQPESENENAYILVTQDIGAERKYMDAPLVITPHLDRYWHEEGIIPSLYAKQRQEVHHNYIKAFIYGIGYGLFQRCSNQDDDSMTWQLKSDDDSPILIRKCGSHIDDSYYSLLDSLLFNKLIVKKVLSYVQAVEGTECCAKIDSVLDSTLISGLCGSNNSNANILDVFLSVCPFMQEYEWNEMFDILLYLLWEFLNLLGSPLSSIDQYSQKIITAIFASCTVSRKKNESLLFGDKMLIQQYKRILEIRYKAQ